LIISQAIGTCLIGLHAGHPVLILILILIPILMADYARHSSLVTGCQWHHSSVSVTTATTQVTTTRPRTIRGPLYLHGYIVHHSSHPPTDAQAVYNCLHQPRVIVASHSTLTPPHRDPPSPLLPDILTMPYSVHLDLQPLRQEVRPSHLGPMRLLEVAELSRTFRTQNPPSLRNSSMHTSTPARN
jgi:hypothetical protein